jgi:hypothetical protein
MRRETVIDPVYLHNVVAVRFAFADTPDQVCGVTSAAVRWNLPPPLPPEVDPKLKEFFK